MGGIEDGIGTGDDKAMTGRGLGPESGLGVEPGLEIVTAREVESGTERQPESRNKAASWKTSSGYGSSW